MKVLFGSLVMILTMILVGAYAWSHRSTMSIAPAPAHEPEAQAPEPQPKSAEEARAGQMVTMVGPLAEYMANQNSGEADPAHEKPHVSVALDHVGDSPVGTSTPLLQKTFRVAAAVNLPFDLPPHAASAKLRGTYQSFVSKGGSQAGEKIGDATTDVEFLLLNEQQYSDLVNGHPADAVYSSEGSSSQEINFIFPPSGTQPVKYHLVFRNGSAGNKVVKADFRIDF